jgi:hypothetical protein
MECEHGRGDGDKIKGRKVHGKEGAWKIHPTYAAMA